MPSASSDQDSLTTRSNEKISTGLDDNISTIRDEFKDTSDLVVRRLTPAEKPEQKVAVVYLASVVDLRVVRESIIEPLVMGIGFCLPDPANSTRSHRKN